METYTFSVNYIQGPDQTKQLADVQVKGLIGKPFTIKSAQSGLQSSIRSLVAFCGTLPMLPGKLPQLPLVYRSSRSTDCGEDY